MRSSRCYGVLLTMHHHDKETRQLGIGRQNYTSAAVLLMARLSLDALMLIVKHLPGRHPQQKHAGGAPWPKPEKVESERLKTWADSTGRIHEKATRYGQVVYVSRRGKYAEIYDHNTGKLIWGFTSMPFKLTSVRKAARELAALVDWSKADTLTAEQQQTVRDEIYMIISRVEPK